MFKWLFRERQKLRPDDEASVVKTIDSTVQSTKNLNRAEIREIIEGWLSIPTIDFYGSYATSPNGRYRVAWRDGGTDRGDGQYILIDGEQIVCQGQMERPHDGKVADNGVFILNDWRAQGTLAGTFRAFRADGSPLAVQDYAANLFNNGLSSDGRFAACQTCNSGEENDSAILTVFDLTDGSELSRFRAESGWPQTYRFSLNGETLFLGYPHDEGEFAYKLDGTFMDREAWISARLKRGDLYMARRIFDEVDRKPEIQVADQLLQSIEIGLVHPTWREDRSQVYGYRLQGEVLESIGRIEQAVESYDRALALNPKIGIRRRVQQLRKTVVKNDLA
jgi:hypothetical protein